jgi:hypothetical protein
MNAKEIIKTLESFTTPQRKKTNEWFLLVHNLSMIKIYF